METVQPSWSDRSHFRTWLDVPRAPHPARRSRDVGYRGGPSPVTRALAQLQTRYSASMRRASIAARLVLLVPLMFASCGTTSEPASSTSGRAQDPPTEPSGDGPVSAPSANTGDPVAPPEPPPKREPYVPDPDGFGDACLADTECGWDDPCVPTRCVGASNVPSDLKCDETAPPPGTCSCVERRCSLRPNEAPAPAPSCRREACGLDQSAGRCVAGTQLEANRYIRTHGPACHCDQDTLECQFVWVEPIECEDENACWVSNSRPYHPIARPKSLRGREFRPCRDGEVAPVCTDGMCGVVPFKC